MHKPWQVFFRQAPRDLDAQGESTGDDDFTNEAEDDALAEEGEAELGEEDGDGEEEPEDDDEDEQPEGQDDDEDEEGEEEEESEEEEEVPAFKFKNPETGDFDFRRINKVLGGGELENYFKEQNATITRTSQELKSYKDLGAPPQELKHRSTRALFFDKLYNENPAIKREVNRVLGLAADEGDESPEAYQLPQGVDPKDPLAEPVVKALKEVTSISNRLKREDQQRQFDAQERRFAQALNEGNARFKELTGKDLSQEQLDAVNQEMRESGYPNAAKLIPGLFFEEIQKAAAEKLQKKRMVKKNLPKTSSKGRSPAPGKAKRVSRRDVFDQLWEKEMGSDE